MLDDQVQSQGGKQTGWQSYDEYMTAQPQAQGEPRNASGANQDNSANGWQSYNEYIGNNATDGQQAQIKNGWQSYDEYVGVPESKNTILPQKAAVTQNFGNYNPSLEIFSGGYARDTNFSANFGDPVSLPQGNWQVVSTYDQAEPQGYPGNASNKGYGNSVMVQNTDTGERLHFIHLAHVAVQPGQILQNGVIGNVGSSGNATAPNLGIEYYNSGGNLGDVMTSNYARYL